ncbi:MAG: c-type cytochrome [Acidobacteria bacterium]|nr:c-type cytochrome [Acidobacteriota bacterium]
MIWTVLLLFAQAASSQTQIERGEALFFNQEKGCGGCHALKGKGTAVGPDLKAIGRLAPAAIAMAVHSSVTQYVEMVKTKEGDSFPGYTAGKEGDKLVIFDLSKNPPEKKVLAAADVTKSGNDKWQHPPAKAKIDAKDLADIVAYIRFAASGSRTAVDPADVQ